MEIPESMYRGCANLLAEAQACGSPVVVIAISRIESPSAIAERVDLFGACHSSVEGFGMIEKIARKIKRGDFDLTGLEAQELIEGE